MEEKIERLIEWFEKGKAYPYTLEFNITSKCNLKCKMCWLRSTKPNYEELDDSEILRIVKEALKMGVEEFRFPGSGEPLMRKNILFQAMKIIKKEERKGVLITNGTLFTEEDVRNVITMGWDVVTISLDGPNEKINDYIRGVKGAFQNAKRTLLLFKKWKKKLKKKNPWIRMNVVLTNKNFDKLDKMIILAKKMSVNEVLLQPLTIFSETGRKLQVSNIEKLNKSLEKALKFSKKFKIKTNMETFIENLIVEKTNKMEEMIKEEIKKYRQKFLRIPCYEPFYNLIILPNGSIASCAVGNPLINIKNKSLEKVWFSKELMEARRRLIKGILFPFCSHCCVPIFLENRRIRKILSRLIK